MIFYTDGACRGNPGPGGWAFVALEGEEVREHRTGGAARTTNNIMEMTAALEALKCCASIGGNFHILYTDSAYVLGGLTSWCKNWQKNGWLTSKKEPVKNQELWRELWHWYQKCDISICKVKGHADSYWNNFVDEAAVFESKQF